MAKARSLPKAARKAERKPVRKAKPRAVAGARPAKAKVGKSLRAPKSRRAARTGGRLEQAPVVIPETPPPLPAPIASFTF